ncbi:metal cation symporter ZIP14-like [Saccoglossus kowalevskii]|uniref:Zinc transporter ZIP14-like n=1 Tax=Saccoglossus kowalevskii TaxID=10224 RepID=A0ABM0GWW7_SACKO|nr:PREDICTED: zinc transporter ZIP14-like [Saccoglossus kowalevskii]
MNPTNAAMCCLGVLYTSLILWVPTSLTLELEDNTLELKSYFPSPDEFLDDLINEYGSDGTLSVKQLQHLLGKFTERGSVGSRNLGQVAGDVVERNHAFASPSFEHPRQTELGHDTVNDRDQGGNDLSRGLHNKGGVMESTQKESRCYTSEEILQIHNMDSDIDIDRHKMVEMCPVILQQISKGCDADDDVADQDDGDDDETLEFEHFWLHRVLRNVGNETDDSDDSPTTAEVWGYSFLFVTLINLCSLVGVTIVPFMKKKVYQTILMFLICLAVGTLSGSALLHLLPEAHGMLVVEPGYVWINTTVLGGIYLFFLTEKIMKIYINRRKRLAKAEAKETGSIELKSADLCSLMAKPGHSDHRILDPVEEAANNIDKDKCIDISNGTSKHTTDSEMGNNITVAISNGNVFQTFQNEENGLSESENTPLGHKHCAHTDMALKETPTIATVAWMVIFGDGLHNFIDGLTIGAAFSVSVMNGISVCIAVVCEEFPHELGDFAILLNAGMSVKKALTYNFLSACMCYLGLVCGILLTNHTDAAVYIFAIAAGMFLYISLVDMLPEINSVEEDEENISDSKQAKIFVIQNCGLLLGWATMIILALVEANIQIG